jgi:hypothetical protein
MAQSLRGGSMKSLKSLKRFRYDYYEIAIPGDCADTIEALANIAIDEARERTRLYCIPALWVSRWISGEIGDWIVRFRVIRKRNN